jgi:SARP family transcriptional regulator, regulator of embCAB operon
LDPGSPTRIQLCGRLVVVWDGARVEERLPSRKGRLLFAFLATHRQRPAARSALVDAVWPDRPPAAAASALNALLSKLRAVLGHGALAGKDELRLVLPPDAYVDVDAARDRLHEAESAVAQSDWRRAWAPARAALHTADRGFLPGHEAPWVEDLRRELDEIGVRALQCVAATGLGLGGGELAAAERAGRRLVAERPFLEAGHVHLMRALVASGNVAEALLAYDRLRTTLREELGVAPPAALQALHAELLRAC